ncbi:hypothetical protein PIB30_106881, partial [Stylosanthes scabra]|nr:hypothetical protein [Stylosanthes scabra]
AISSFTNYTGYCSPDTLSSIPIYKYLFIYRSPLQHGLAVPTVIIDGFMDTAPTDGLAVDNNITTV